MREKAIYYHLNMLKQSDSGFLYQGLVWCPKSFKFDKVVADIIRDQGLQGLNVQKGPANMPGLKQPTLFKTNEFTGVFQQIVDTYGVPSYKEVNPAIFTCVSFPFFFGIMFGDIMHGFILVVFASYLCFAKREPGTVSATFGPMRYILLLMGLFSFYCGLIYNDFASLATQIFGETCYSVSEDAEKVAGSPGYYYATKADKDCVYPFGIDHTWYRSTQEIAVMNSLKMKTSVIFGVVQMLLGTCMKGMNALYFRRYGEFLFDVITQILLLVALFGFMDYMIVVKWTTDWDTHKANTGETAPDIIGAMIIMFIGMGKKTPSDPPIADVIPNQESTMKSLLLLALICVPTMLLVNPIIHLLKAKKHAPKVNEVELAQIEGDKVYGDDYINQDHNDFRSLASSVMTADSGDHSFGEIMIHQMIETIEYALGTVSNTASYLRLWALSLAHGQLAKVFFDYTIAVNLKEGGYVSVSTSQNLILIFCSYSFLTISSSESHSVCFSAWI